MIYQNCAICNKSDYRVVYKENFDLKKINEKIFSARRLPDRIHYRIVQCNNCKLIYSNPVIEYGKIASLYQKSFVSYDEQIENLRETYGYYLKQLDKYRVSKERLLEIGCGNGFFLEEALKQNYGQVYGVEPGKKSVAKANHNLKTYIKEGIFKPSLFHKNFFDVICCFQTLDHIPDPNKIIKECYKILKRGGYMLFLNHDVESLFAKILGEKSPIIDIEHTYLYSHITIKKIFEKHNFKVLKVESALNIHKLAYWIHLMPIPNNIKHLTVKLLKFFKLDNLTIKIYPGNLVIIATK